MPSIPSRLNVSRLAADYGLVGVLLLLCLCCSVITYEEQQPEGRQAARIVAAQIAASADQAKGIAIITEDAVFADALDERLTRQGIHIVEKATGDTRRLRGALEKLLADRVSIEVIATTDTSRLLVEDALKESSASAGVRVVPLREVLQGGGGA